MAYSSDCYIAGSEYRRYRAELTYTTSETATAVIISFTATVQMANAALYGVAITCEGKTSTGYLASSSSSYVNVASVSGTKTVAKGTTSSSYILTAKAYGTTVSGYGSAGGETSVSVVVPIPALPLYTLTVNPKGGTFSDGTTEPKKMSPKLVYKGGNWNNLSGEKPTREGYEFEGFYDANGVQVYGADGVCIEGIYWSNNLYMYNGDLTVYAQWAPTADQSIYICENVIYAKGFIVDETMNAIEMDKQGFIYAASFTESDKLLFGKEGVQAKEFVRGTPE